MSFRKSAGDIEFATCQCQARRAGTCLHSYAVSKVIAKWAINRISIIPQQSRGRVEGHSINYLEIKSPPSKNLKLVKVTQINGEQLQHCMMQMHATDQIMKIVIFQNC